MFLDKYFVDLEICRLQVQVDVYVYVDPLPNEV